VRVSKPNRLDPGDLFLAVLLLRQFGIFFLCTDQDYSEPPQSASLADDLIYPERLFVTILPGKQIVALLDHAARAQLAVAM
jgi:hypothetical protein